MQEKKFEAEVEELAAYIEVAVKNFFMERGAVFDTEAFNNQTSTCVDQAVREMFFFGANIFPSLDCELLAA